MSAVSEELERNFGLPEQARIECTEYREHYANIIEAQLKVDNMVSFLSAKAIAMTQAGLIPHNTDPELTITTVMSSLELDGLH